MGRMASAAGAMVAPLRGMMVSAVRSTVKPLLDIPGKTKRHGLLYYSFCLVDSLVIGNYSAALAALGHLCALTVGTYGMSVPVSVHWIIAKCAKAYDIRKSMLVTCTDSAYRKAFSFFTNHAGSIMSFCGKEQWGQFYHAVRLVYRVGVCLLNPTQIIYEILPAIRAGLISLELYPTVEY